MSVPEVETTQLGHLHEYHKIELAEIFVKTRSLLALRTQIWTFVGTVNLTFIGIAVKENSKVFFIIAVILMCLPVILDAMLLPIIDVVLARGLYIEKMYAFDKQEALQFSMILSYYREPERYEISAKLQLANTVNQIVKVIKKRRFNKVGIPMALATIFSEAIAGLVFFW